jgi:hypothetical protein
MRRWLWLAALGACSGCNLVTGIDDYQASEFVGEWAGETTLLGHKYSIRIYGDFTGDGTVPVSEFGNQFGSVQDVGVSLDWDNTDQVDEFTVVLTCGDSYCAEAATEFRRTLTCTTSNGGQNLSCHIDAGQPLAGTPVVKFRRTQ